MRDNIPSTPVDFLDRIREQISDWTAFVDVLDTTDSPTSIRVNKKKLPQAYPFEFSQELKWNASGKYLSERPSYKRDLLFQAGCYYPMEASSMFVDQALKQVELQHDDLILDLCAAPGGKSLILRDHFSDNLIVSNEIENKRAHILKENIIRWGSLDHLVVQSEAAKLGQSGLKFKLILVDAPCSGEGMFRKDPSSRAEWTAERAHGCALRQQGIIDDVKDLLAAEAYLIYSTCTYNREENDDQIERLLDSGDFELVQLNVEESWNLEATKYGYQFWPHRIQGEGFFISLLKFTGTTDLDFKERKPNSTRNRVQLDLVGISDELILEQHDTKVFAYSQRELAVVDQLKGCCQFIKKGIMLGEFKGHDFLPSHDYMMTNLSAEFEPKIELNESQGLQYLAGQALIIPDLPKGPVQLTYQHIPIGVGKSNGQRINNLVPKHLRIT